MAVSWWTGQTAGRKQDRVPLIFHERTACGIYAQNSYIGPTNEKKTDLDKDRHPNHRQYSRATCEPAPFYLFGLSVRRTCARTRLQAWPNCTRNTRTPTNLWCRCLFASANIQNRCKQIFIVDRVLSLPWRGGVRSRRVLRPWQMLRPLFMAALRAEMDFYRREIFWRLCLACRGCRDDCSLYRTGSKKTSRKMLSSLHRKEKSLSRNFFTSEVGTRQHIPNISLTQKRTASVYVITATHNKDIL